ncbi:MAG: GNAT family N-acetyltransferase [Lutibacter sp.]
MLSFRKATIADEILYFDWANDSGVREQSYNTNPIDFDSHCKWFKSKIEDTSCLMLLFQNEKNLNIGQVRIQKENIKEALIGISIAIEHRGKSYAKEMLQVASDYFLDLNKGFKINAFIKMENLSSKYAFEKAGFEFEAEKIYENIQSFHYTKKLK